MDYLKCKYTFLEIVSNFKNYSWKLFLFVMILKFCYSLHTWNIQGLKLVTLTIMRISFPFSTVNKWCWSLWEHGNKSLYFTLVSSHPWLIESLICVNLNCYFLSLPVWIWAKQKATIHHTWKKKDKQKETLLVLLSINKTNKYKTKNLGNRVIQTNKSSKSCAAP